MPLGSGLDAQGEHFALTPIEDARTLSPLGLIIRRGEPRSALAEACFREAATLLDGSSGE